MHEPENSPLILNAHIVKAKGNSAAFHNCWRPQDTHCLTKIKIAKPCNIILPNATAVKPSLRGQLPLHNALSYAAKDTTIIPSLKSPSLISLGQLSDDGCKASLDKKDLKAFKDKKLILKGCWNLSDGLWDMPIVASTACPGLHASRVKHKSITASNTKKPKSIPKVHQHMHKEPALQQIDQHV